MPDTAYHPLVRAVAAALRRRCGVGRAVRDQQNALPLLVGVSGGADSVALLRALHHLAQRRGWSLALGVAHVNHHLRDDADDEARCVGELAESLGLRCVTRDIYPGPEIDEQGGNLEAVARRMRYAALADVCRQHGTQHVAVAHHADDQAETVLMRLVRGTGVRGLGGMAWHRRLGPSDDPPIHLIRPMLGVTHDQAIDYLNSLNQPWREDATNRDTTRARALLRERVLPVLREMRPDAVQRIGTAAGHAREMDYAVKRIAGRSGAAVWSRASATDRMAPRDAVRELPGVIRAMVLRDAIEQLGLDADRLSVGKLEKLSKACADRRGGERLFELGSGIVATVTREQVCLTLHSSSEASRAPSS